MDDDCVNHLGTQGKPNKAPGDQGFGRFARKSQMQQKRIKSSVKNSLTGSKISEKSEIKSRGGQCNENLILLFETIKASRHLLTKVLYPCVFISVSSLCLLN